MPSKTLYIVWYIPEKGYKSGEDEILFTSLDKKEARDALETIVKSEYYGKEIDEGDGGVYFEERSLGMSSGVKKILDREIKKKEEDIPLKESEIDYDYWKRAREKK